MNLILFILLKYLIKKTQNKNYNYNTSVHNVKMIKKSLEKVKINNDSNYFYLLGDKGYKTKEIFKLNNVNS